MSTHTPGPWHVENDGEWTLIRGRDPELGDDYPGPMVATTTNNRREEANGRLIAAAPDLLAALKLADTILDGFPLYATGHGGKTIRAAIAKAEGTQS